MNEAFALSGSGLPLRASAVETRGSALSQRYAFILPSRKRAPLAQARIAFPGVDLSPLEPQPPIEQSVAEVAIPRVSKQEIAAARLIEIPAAQSAMQVPSPAVAEAGETVVVRMQGVDRSVAVQPAPAPSHVHTDVQAAASEPIAGREMVATPRAQTEVRVDSKHASETRTERRIVERLQTQVKAERFDRSTHSETLRLEKSEAPPRAPDLEIPVEQTPGPVRLRETERLIEIRTAPLVKEAVRMANMGAPNRASPAPQAEQPIPMTPILERIAAATAPKEEKAIRIGSVQVSVRSQTPAPIAAPIMQAPLTSGANGVAARSAYRNPWLSRNRQD